MICIVQSFFDILNTKTEIKTIKLNLINTQSHIRELRLKSKIINLDSNLDEKIVRIKKKI